MFVKMYQYYIKRENEEAFILLQKKVNNIYSKYLDKHTRYWKSMDIEYKWYEVSTYQDKESYLMGIQKVNEHPEIQELFQEFQALLLENKEIKEDNLEELLDLKREG